MRVLLFVATLLFFSNGFGQGTGTSYLIEVDSSFCKNDLRLMGTNIRSSVGNIVTVNLTSNQVKELTLHPGVLNVQRARSVQPALDRVVTDMRVDSVYSATNLQQAYTGKDVIIGVTDWGFDYTHPMFYDTALQHTRILAAWDQYKRSGPAPNGFTYGTEYKSETELLNAGSDTANVYDYGTHGTHVAGIAGGSGAGTAFKGVAYEANFLFVTFLIDEAAVLDAFAWMKQKAEAAGKPLVINMSWGLYHMGTLDGSSLLSKAIDLYSEQGVVFVTSAGNNGDENMHIRHNFNQDTIHSGIGFFPFGAHKHMWGQSISIWGEPNNAFMAQIQVLNDLNQRVSQSPLYATNLDIEKDSFLLIGNDTVFLRIQVEKANPNNNRPHMRLRVKNTHSTLKIALKAFAEDGTVHFWNVTELTTDVGNWGMPFEDWLPGWLEGNANYTLGEPSSTRSVITVAAHSSEVRLQNGNVVGGFRAGFSSIGPTLDGRLKPDVSAPGRNVASSVSSFASEAVSAVANVEFKGKTYEYARFSGTSMSSPAVAGVVALMLQAQPKLTAKQVKNLLIKSARQDENTGEIPNEGSTLWGWGKVNAIEAVRLAEAFEIPVDTTSDLVFPNPATNSIYHAQTNEAMVYNTLGKLVAKGPIGRNEALSVAHLEPGMYFIDLSGSIQVFLVVR